MRVPRRFAALNVLRRTNRAGLTALPQSNIARLHAPAWQRTIATRKNSPGESLYREAVDFAATGFKK
jgi:hypothetical protein